MGAYAGVDLGATHILAVVCDESGRDLGSGRNATPQGPTGIDVTESVLETLRDACDDADVVPTELDGVGIASFGPLDLAAGVVENPANMPDTIDRIPLTGPVKNLVESDDVVLHNDAIAGLVGERFYADRNPDDMIYLTISSGIGAGVAVDRNVLSGWDGNVGEVGHMVVDPTGMMPCGCGREGHWEAYCSGENIPRYAAALHEDDPVDTSLSIEAEMDAATVFEQAEDGDPFANDVLERVGKWNAVGVANMVHAYAPLVIYVGGAVALNNPERTIEPIKDRIGDMVMSNVPDVQLTTLGDEIVAYGAMAAALTGGTGRRSR
jgi:glucokinase